MNDFDRVIDNLLLKNFLMEKFFYNSEEFSTRGLFRIDITLGLWF